MANFDTNAGATFSVSAAAPTTYDDNVTTGYPSLTFTPATAAEITNYNGPNPEWSTTTDNTYNTSDKADRKSSRALGTCDITLNYLSTNSAFWDIIDTAELSKSAVLSVQFSHSNGSDLQWYTVQIVQSGKTYGGPDDFETRQIMMLAQTDIVAGTV